MACESSATERYKCDIVPFNLTKSFFLPDLRIYSCENLTKGHKCNPNLLFHKSFFFFFFLAALGLRCCVRAFSSCSDRRLLLVAVHGLLIAVASLVVEHRL